jgi:hypothetical protein
MEAWKKQRSTILTAPSPNNKHIDPDCSPIFHVEGMGILAVVTVWPKKDPATVWK